MHGKGFTREELWAEWSRVAVNIGLHGPFVWGQRMLAVQHALDRPDARDNGYL